MRGMLLAALALAAVAPATAEVTHVVDVGEISCRPDAAVALSAAIARGGASGFLTLVGGAWDLVDRPRGECAFTLSVGAAVAEPLPGAPAAGGISAPLTNGCRTTPPAGCNVSAHLGYWLDPATTAALRIPFSLELDGRALAAGEVTVFP